jgi:thiol:disulfide interchange protein
MTVDQTGPPPPDVGPPPHRRRSLRWVALAVTVPLLGLVGVMAASPLAATRAARSPLLSKAAPAVTAESLDGQALRLADYRGRWVLVNFFAIWCVPCCREHPALIAFRQRHRPSATPR